MQFSAHCTDFHLGISCFLRRSDLIGKEHFKSQNSKMWCILMYSCKLDHVSSLLSVPPQFLISPRIKAKVLTMAWKTRHPANSLPGPPSPLYNLILPVRDALPTVPPARLKLFSLGCPLYWLTRDLQA